MWLHCLVIPYLLEIMQVYMYMYVSEVKFTSKCCFYTLPLISLSLDNPLIILTISELSNFSLFVINMIFKCYKTTCTCHVHCTCIYTCLCVFYVEITNLWTSKW